MADANTRLYPSLDAIAGLFHPPEQITSIDTLGSGNVNDTFLVSLAADAELSGLCDAASEHKRVRKARAGHAQFACPRHACTTTFGYGSS